MTDRYTCDFAETSIFFGYDYVAPCCITPALGVNPPQYFDNVRDLSYIQKVESFLRCRSELISPSLKKDACKNCKYRVSRASNDRRRYETVVLSHIEFCELSCVYCYQSDPGYPKNTKRHPYSFAAILNEMLKRDLLCDNACFFWGGGEPMSSPEFWRTAVEIDALNYRQIINTHAVRHHPQIYETINKRTNATLVCSVDAGISETYRKIKGVDAYHIVWKNLKKYSDGGIRVLPKFIFHHQNYSEANRFIDAARDFGFQSICFDFDLNAAFKISKVLPFQEQFLSALEYTKKQEMQASFSGHSWCALDEAQTSSLAKALSSGCYDNTIEMDPFDKELHQIIKLQYP